MFRKAADQGLVGSLTTLAMMYQEGNGVEKDLDEAVQQRLLALARDLKFPVDDLIFVKQGDVPSTTAD